ncbi:hypothetical protein HXX76_012473 [Chlamydomonas incerta]|uniref:Protein kinase domain-containing protein n=1 Tax=Chlamydomonas incerta TaxID=51695 RepID=A0A835SLL8_CHLIN|nr:hypothetical protein HXX76_012473 [Chlamydomonas incerta]|eukprot:KAG2427277.1 hypothetical protein HXX76_012473 [Chlamydomonas incerta]
MIINDISMTEASWDGFHAGVVVAGCLRLVGNRAAGAVRPVLDLGFANGKVKLVGKGVLSLEYVVLQNFRAGNQNQAPGIDLLASSDPAEPPLRPLLQINDSVLVNRVCYPSSLRVLSGKALVRPASIPGNNSAKDLPPDPNCSPDPSTPVLDRCWPDQGIFTDLAMGGLTFDKYSHTVPTGWDIHLLNVYFVCEMLLTEDCIARLGLIGCAVAALSRQAAPGSSSSSSSSTALAAGSAADVTATAAAAAGGAAAPGGSGSSGGGSSSLSSGAIAGIVVGSVLGALAVVGAVVLIVRRRRRRGHQRLGAPPAQELKCVSSDGGAAAAAGAQGCAVAEPSKAHGESAAVAGAAAAAAVAAGGGAEDASGLDSLSSGAVHSVSSVAAKHLLQQQLQPAVGAVAITVAAVAGGVASGRQPQPQQQKQGQAQAQPLLGASPAAPPAGASSVVHLGGLESSAASCGGLGDAPTNTSSSTALLWGATTTGVLPSMDAERLGGGGAAGGGGGGGGRADRTLAAIGPSSAATAGNAMAAAAAQADAVAAAAAANGARAAASDPQRQQVPAGSAPQLVGAHEAPQPPLITDRRAAAAAAAVAAPAGMAAAVALGAAGGGGGGGVGETWDGDDEDEMSATGVGSGALLPLRAVSLIGGDRAITTAASAALRPHPPVAAAVGAANGAAAAPSRLGSDGRAGGGNSGGSSSRWPNSAGDAAAAEAGACVVTANTPVRADVNLGLAAVWARAAPSSDGASGAATAGAAGGAGGAAATAAAPSNSLNVSSGTLGAAPPAGPYGHHGLNADLTPNNGSSASQTAGGGGLGIPGSGHYGALPHGASSSHAQHQRGPTSAPAAPTASGGGGGGSAGVAVAGPDAATATSTAQASAAAIAPEDDDEVHLLPVVRGRGSFGRVVEGVYKGQRVAVKLMTAAAAAAVAAAAADGGAGGQTADEADGDCGGGGTNGLVRAFHHEVQVLARLTHPNVVRLIAACMTPPRFCLVMELMETNLESLMRNAPGRLLPMSTVVAIALDVVRGLEYIHPTILHRDLKPANVLIGDPYGPNQVAKLSDFGLARLYSSVLVTRHPEAGTPPYMAPECFDATSRALSHHADAYSFGVLLWAMLSGLEPWQGLNMVRLAYRVAYGGERPPLDAIPPERRLPKLVKLMEQCWQADPPRRPAAAEMVKQLLLVRQMMAREAALNTGSSAGPSSLGSTA